MICNQLMKFTKRGLLFCMAAGFSCCVFAFEKFTDEKGEYVIGSDGAKHYYLFAVNKTSGTYWSFNNVTYSRANALAAVVEPNFKWVNGSIFAFEKDCRYSYTVKANPSATLYGIDLETTDAGSLRLQGKTAKYSIGEFGVRSRSGHKINFVRADDYNVGTEGAEIHLEESQTWSGPDANSLSSAPFIIVPNYLASKTCRGYVSAKDDIVWTLAGDMVLPWLISNHALTNIDIVIKSPALIALHKGDWGEGKLHARKVTFDGGYGIKFGKDTVIIPYTSTDNNYGGSRTYGIGSVPLITPVQVAETIELKNGATLKAIETTVVSGGVSIVSSGTITNKVEGVFNFADNDTTFHIEEGSVLDLSAASLTGSGKYAFTGAGGVVLPISGAADEFLHLPDFSGHTGELSVIVASGTLVLENATAIPEGCTIVTEGDGGVLVIDDTGFDAETMLGGTKKKVEPSRLVVTDADVEGEVSVEDGETLNVFGNGLGENASLKLWGGATVMFRKNASVSSPVWSTNTVTFKTFDSSVTGTVAGVYSKNGSQTVDLRSPGLLVLSGGGVIGIVNMYNGNVAVTGKYSVKGATYFYGGHMLVHNGGEWVYTANDQHLRLDKNSEGDSCLEIGPGGYVDDTANSHSTYIGSTSYQSKLLVSGGHFCHRYHNFGMYKNSTVEIRSGTFECRRRISCSGTADNSKIILGDGTWYCYGGNYCPQLFTGTGFCTVSFEGNSTLNIANGQQERNDTTNDVPQCTYVCKPGSRLKLIGRSDVNSILTLHNFNADGLVFDINDIPDRTDKGIKVKFVDPGENVAVGYVLPGISGNEFMPVAGEGASVRLNASYVVPEGVTFDTSSLPQGWYSGFAETSVSNLVFETGSTLQFPFPTAPYAPLSIAGSLTLPAAMNYTATGTSKPKVKLATIVDPAEGIIQGEEECVWTSTGWLNPEYATFSAVEGKLVFSYDPPGTILILR